MNLLLLFKKQFCLKIKMKWCRVVYEKDSKLEEASCPKKWLEEKNTVLRWPVKLSMERARTKKPTEHWTRFHGTKVKCKGK